MPDNEVPLGQSSPLSHDDPHLTARIAAHEREVEHLRQRYHETGNENLARDVKLAEIVLNLGYQDKQLAKIVTALDGNGKPGLSTRIDRLEVSEQRRINLNRAVVGSFIASSISFIFYLLKSLSLGGHR